LKPAIQQQVVNEGQSQRISSGKEAAEPVNLQSIAVL